MSPRLLARCVDVTFIVVSVVLAGSIVHGVWLRPAGKHASVNTIRGTAALPAELRVPSTSKTRRVVFFVNSHCEFCTDSLPFYERVVAAAGRRSNAPEIVFASLEPQADLDAYLKGHAIAGATVQMRSPGALTGTPTLLVLLGQEVASWEGKLTHSQEQDVLRLLGLDN
jgi:hypothetical protein